MSVYFASIYRAPGAVLAILCAVALATAPQHSLASGELGACGAPATRVHAIQGAGSSSPQNRRPDVVVEGVVVGDFQGFPGGLGGFFLQEEDADADSDPATSEGIFVFDAGSDVDVEIGDRVRVRGDVWEFFGLTELGRLTGLAVCEPRGRASAARVELPVDDPADWERWEGMRVRIEQTLAATDHYDLGRFGELDLAAGERLWQPTHQVAPGDAARALAHRNERHRILLDDGSHARDPDPIPYLTAAESGTLRLGDRLAGVEGVLDFAFGRYRIHPTEPVFFESGNPRPASPPDVAGTLRIVAWNVANFFNGDGRGGGFPTRGARSAVELARQRAKLVESLARLEPDVAALVELENDGVGPGSALRELADALEHELPHLRYTAIDPGRVLGGQAIAVGLLYRPDAALPIGDPSVLDERAHPGFDSARNRPSLAQTFETRATGERLTVVVNHLKSKGSSCDSAGDPDLGDGQGACNATRAGAASALVEWLSGDPTRSGDARVLVVGDLNAHPREDPVQAIEAAGLVDLFAWFGTPDAYTFVFDGEAGRLDHALASASLLPFVGGVGIWHANADEPPPLDYREGNPPWLYAPDPFRASDHDPVWVGLFPDADADGVTDARDECPHSQLAETVVLRGCDSGVPEALDVAGCTLADRLVALAEASRHRGERARRARRWLLEQVASGTLARRHFGPILACVVKRNVGQAPSSGPSVSPRARRVRSGTRPRSRIAPRSRSG
jgi:predicted extracellular nuclease